MSVEIAADDFQRSADKTKNRCFLYRFGLYAHVLCDEERFVLILCLRSTHGLNTNVRICGRVSLRVDLRAKEERTTW